MVLPEMRHFADGLELADSYVFNPHKWMFTNFDCSAYFVRDPQMLIRTFEILPEYLKTRTRGQVNDYRETMVCHPKFWRGGHTAESAASFGTGTMAGQ